jgi:hypothetical protein
MITKIPIEWNVYYYNSNSRKIEIYNVFNHWRFIEYSAKHIKKYKDDKEGLKEQIRKELMYYYWSKYEREVIVAPFTSDPKEEEEIKIDVYEQVMLNWDRFFEYFWEHKKEIIKYDKEMRKSCDYYGKS